MVKGVGLWRNGRKGRIHSGSCQKEMIARSGTQFNVHKFIGTYSQGTNSTDVSTQQMVLLLMNYQLKISQF